MSSSHSSIPKPSTILALVALGLVIRFEPTWASIELQQAAKLYDFSPQRLSRLVTRAVTYFGTLLEVWTRRGRPPSDRGSDELVRELERVRALLEVATSLRAYQHGARMAREAIEQRGDVGLDDLERAASRARQQAQAHDRSARLLLAEIHDQYDIKRDKKRFVDGLRRYPLPVLQQAEKDFSKQVHREDILDRASYFAAIVRRCHDDYRLRRARVQQEARERQQREEHDRAVEQQQREHASAPAGMIRDALELIALQWDSTTRQLLFDGAGPGQGMLHKAFDQLSNSLGAAAAKDIVRGVFHDFEIGSNGTLDSEVTRAIGVVLNKVAGVTGGETAIFNRATCASCESVN